MNPANAEQELFRSQLKHLIVDLFRLPVPEPDRISNQAPLMGGDLGLDSLDALELAIRIEEKFGVTIQSNAESNDAFANVDSLAAFICKGRFLNNQPRLTISEHTPARASY